MCRDELKKAVNRNLFPGTQGGPLVHVIAAKAVCFKLAMSSEFREYQQQVLQNAKALSTTMVDRGFRVVSGGTDTHLFLVDVFRSGLTGKQAEEALEEASITVNKNTIPFDQHPPLVTSGIRVGTPAVTTRGMCEGEMEQIGHWMADVLDDIDNERTRDSVKKEVRSLGARFPLYAERLTMMPASG